MGCTTTVTTIGVVGAGQMGSGIAQVAGASGYKVFLWDIDNEATKRSIESIGKRLERLVEKEKISQQDAESAKNAISPVNELKDLKECDLVIEAATEKEDIKRGLFKELDSFLKKDAIIATNTSSISITMLASVTANPERVLGMHFMNPVPVMKLVELIRGMQTSEDVFATAKEVVAKMGKTGVEAKDSPGFTVNRILAPMINEAVFLLQEGTKPEDIDNAMVLGTNQPMGPLALADLIGLDTCLYIMQVLHKELGEDKYRPCPLLVKYVEAGWLGRKTKRGFYTYD